jgi:hypothetical protein
MWIVILCYVILRPNYLEDKINQDDVTTETLIGYAML